jgi:hypothetical protein
MQDAIENGELEDLKLILSNEPSSLNALLGVSI